jgi:hypothetical protein
MSETKREVLSTITTTFAAAYLTIGEDGMTFR